MAKAQSDIILRDRLQITIDSGGDLSTVYGRLDLSDYVNPVEKKGLSIKELHVQLRHPQLGNTGNFITSLIAAGGNNSLKAGMKVYATTRAYENAADVGIASPDVLHCETWNAFVPAGVDQGAGIVNQTNTQFEHQNFGVLDLHPSGFPLVSDLLIGFASDGAVMYANQTLEIDIMLIAESVNITAKDLTQMLTQSQDL